MKGEIFPPVVRIMLQVFILIVLIFVFVNICVDRSSKHVEVPDEPVAQDLDTIGRR